MASDNAAPAAAARSHTSSVGADYRDDEYSAMEEFRTTSIYSALTSLLGSEKFSDMTIRCGGREFKTHRAIVCSQSPFFDRALTGGFVEAINNTVDLPEDDPDVLECFLQFLYTGTYKDNGSAWTGPTDVCMLTPEEIEEELNMIPGVNVAGPPDEQVNGPTVELTLATAEGTRSRASAIPDGDSQTEHDGSGSELSDEAPEEPEEPEEEYNYFDEKNGGGNHEDDPSLDKRFVQLISEFGAEEGARRFYRELHSQQDLFLPLRLYVMADKFDVPALKLFARDRFYRAAELSWRVSEDFPAVVDELYTTLPPTDIAMREIVCRLVGFAIKDNDQRSRMEEVMRKHGDFAVGVMNYMLASAQHVWT